MSYHGNFQAIILAAGSSSRFKTSLSKLCHDLCGQPIIAYPVRLFAEHHIPVTCVVGYQKDAVITALEPFAFPDLSFVTQETPKGTGHALWCTKHRWERDHIIVMYGDMPLIPSGRVENLIATHISTHASISMVTFKAPDLSYKGYGRIIEENGVISIIEERNFTGDRSILYPLNAGLYIFKRSFLEATIGTLTENSLTGEIYIVDLIKQASQSGLTVSLVEAPFDEMRGINTLDELAHAEAIQQTTIIKKLTAQGVRFIKPETTRVDFNVAIEPDTVIDPHCTISGETTIGHRCRIGTGSVLQAATLEDEVSVEPYSIISDSLVKQGAQVGPYAHIKKSTIGEKSTIGNFVETNRSTIGEKSKAKHLSYLGDAVIGNHVNIGALTVTCNYDGFAKHQTTIQDHASIGALNALVAPLSIGAGALTAAGSTITQPVPNDALAIARAEQVTKEGYAPRLREKVRQRAQANNDQ